MAAYATTHRLIVRGVDIQTRTPRRYVVVAVRPNPVVGQAGTYVQFARVLKTTDHAHYAKKAARRYAAPYGALAVIIDTVTGEEVPA